MHSSASSKTGAAFALISPTGAPSAPISSSLATDFDRVFGRHAPRVLEIGFGMGETTAQIAAARPDDDFIGIEVHPPGVGSLLKQIDERGLANGRVIRHDGSRPHAVAA